MKDRERDDLIFQARLHDKEMGDRQGRVSGIREGHMARMRERARSRGGH